MTANIPWESTVPKILQEPDLRDLDEEVVEEICENLTELERCTWLAIIDGRLIPDIARDEGVSHPAIYQRIRGKNGKGGMIRKNHYVLLWWEYRQKQRNKTR